MDSRSANPTTYFLALLDEYEPPVPNEDSADIPNILTANPPLPTNDDANIHAPSPTTKNEQEIVNPLSLKEANAKAILEAIKHEIENTEFATATGQWLGMQGGKNIKTSNGKTKLVSETAFNIWVAINDDDAKISFQYTHNIVMGYAKAALKTNFLNFIANNIKRTDGAFELYRRIAENEIKPIENKKTFSNQVYHV